MKLASKLQMSLTKRPGHIVLRRDLAALASASHLTEALRSLVADGRLVRIGAGVYAKSHRDANGKVHLSADAGVLTTEIFTKLGIDARVVEVGHSAAGSVYVMDTGQRRVSRKLNIGSASVAYAERGQPSPADGFTLPDDVEHLPTTGVREFVERLAKVHGIEYRRTGLDDFAEQATRVAGDEVKLDRTGKLLVALKKNNLITGRQLARLVTNHMTEARRAVRPVRGLRDRGLSPQR